MNIKTLFGAAFLATMTAAPGLGFAMAMPDTSFSAAMPSAGTAATEIDWRYRYHNGRHERFWFEHRMMGRFLRHF